MATHIVYGFVEPSQIERNRVPDGNVVKLFTEPAGWISNVLRLEVRC